MDLATAERRRHLLWSTQTSDATRDRIRGALLGAAIGDTLVRELAMTWREEPWRGYPRSTEHVFRSVLRDVP
jgi:hypothetical protein